jgi:hypothetical protein
MINQKNFKHLLLGVCLLATATSAMEVEPLNDQGRNAWGDNENVMTHERRRMCQQSAEQLFAVIEYHMPEDAAMQQVSAWLNRLKNTPAQYNSAQMVRQVNTIDHETGAFVATRNYIDDAIKGFNAIRTNGYFFAERINDVQVPMEKVLTMVWDCYSAISAAYQCSKCC